MKAKLLIRKNNEKFSNFKFNKYAVDLLGLENRLTNLYFANHNNLVYVSNSNIPWGRCVQVLGKKKLHHFSDKDLFSEILTPLFNNYHGESVLKFELNHISNTYYYLTRIND